MSGLVTQHLDSRSYVGLSSLTCRQEVVQTEMLPYITSTNRYYFSFSDCTSTGAVSLSTKVSKPALPVTSHSHQVIQQLTLVVLKTHWHTIFQDRKCIQHAITIIVHFWLPLLVIQVILASLYAKAEGEGLGNLITWFVTWPWYVCHHLSSQQPSDVRDQSCILC